MTNNSPAITQREIADSILARVDEMEKTGMALPINYNPANALNIAFLKLVDMKVRNQPLLQVVTKKSVYETMLNMVLQGLSPAKNQCYFVPYGNELQMQRSYFGTQTAIKRLSGVKDIWANVVFEGDEFDIEIDEHGRERLKVHKTSFLNRDNKIIGAYAVIDTEQHGQLLTVMTKKEIDASWSQAKTTAVQNKFPQEMAKRTVINRAAKAFINTSDDSDLMINAINETTEAEFEENERKDVTAASVTTKTLIEDFAQVTAEDAPNVIEPEEVAPEIINKPEEPSEPRKQANTIGKADESDAAEA